MLNRRDTIRGLVLTIGASSSLLAGRAFAAAALSWTPKALTTAQAGVLDVVSELIIPATDTPGAREAGVPQFIDRALADYCDKAQAARLQGRTGPDERRRPRCPRQ